MKKFTRIIAMLLIVLSVFSASFCSASAAGLSYVNQYFDPSSPSRSERESQQIKELHEHLMRGAYNTYEYMLVPDLASMPSKGTVQYVMGKHGMGANFYDGPNGETLGVIEEGAKVTAYVYSGEYAFVEVENGPVCWCKTQYLYDSFSLEFSLINYWNYLASIGQ